MIKQKRNRQSLISLVLVFCIAATIFIPSKAAAATVPKELKTSVSQVLKAIKNNDDKTLSKYCEENIVFVEDDLFRELVGSELADLILDNINKMSYSVKSYDVKNNKAKVKVKFKYVDLSDFTKNFMDLVIVKRIEDLLSGGTGVLIIKELDEIVKQAIKKSDCSAFLTKTVTLEFKCYEKKWKLIHYSDELSNIVFSNLNDSLLDYMEELEGYLNELYDSLDDSLYDYLDDAQD